MKLKKKGTMVQITAGTNKCLQINNGEDGDEKKWKQFLFNVQEFTLGGPKHLFLMVAGLPALMCVS